jgi:hypothetical protein
MSLAMAARAGMRGNCCLGWETRCTIRLRPNKLAKPPGHPMS